MSQTDNLEINHVEPNQNQKTVTINEAFDIFDGAIAGLYTEDLAGDSGDVTPDSATLKETLVVKTTGAMAGAVNLIVPDFKHAYWIVHNAAGYDLTVKTSGGTGVDISPAAAQLVYCDGTNVIAIGTSGSGGAAQVIGKTKARLTGTGGTNDLAIGATVDPSSIDVFVNGILMDTSVDCSVTESVPASGNYDTLHPLISDIFPAGDTVQCFYYTSGGGGGYADSKTVFEISDDTQTTYAVGAAYRSGSTRVYGDRVPLVRKIGTDAAGFYDYEESGTDIILVNGLSVGTHLVIEYAAS